MCRVLILLLVIAASSGRLWAQAESSPKLLGATEIHCGVSTQSLVHLGARQFISDQVFAEVGFGSVPKFERDMTLFYAHTLGVGFAPQATRSNGSGLFYTLLYSFLGEDFMSSERDYHHLLTANLGFIAQQEGGWSIAARVGAGIFQRNSLRYYYAYEMQRGLTRELTTVIDYPEESYDHELHPWLNLEVAVGFAF